MNDQEQIQNEIQNAQQAPLAPNPIVKKPLWYRLVRGTVFVAIAGGGAFTLLAASMTRARGATQSARLKWQTRQQQVNAAIEQNNVENDDIHSKPVADTPRVES